MNRDEIQPITHVVESNCSCIVGSIIPIPFRIHIQTTALTHSVKTAIHPARPTPGSDTIVVSSD